MRAAGSQARVLPVGLPPSQVAGSTPALSPDTQVRSCSDREHQRSASQGEIGARECDVVEDPGAQVSEDRAHEEDHESARRSDPNEVDPEQAEQKARRAGCLG